MSASLTHVLLKSVGVLMLCNKSLFFVICLQINLIVQFIGLIIAVQYIHSKSAKKCMISMVIKAAAVRGICWDQVNNTDDNYKYWDFYSNKYIS